MKAIVTVLGKDKTGIISGVGKVLAENKANIMDISQTIMQEYFVMIMLVDLKSCECGIAALGDSLGKEGERLGVDIRIQHEDIFNCMHRI